MLPNQESRIIVNIAFSICLKKSGLVAHFKFPVDGEGFFLFGGCMDFVHVRNLEKYHPGYKDRKLQWAKIHFNMVQGDPDCEMIDNEIDFARLIKFIILELRAQKPIPIDPKYLAKNGFDLKKRSIDLTLRMLHNFLDTVSDESKMRVLDKKREEEEKTPVTEIYGEFKNVKLTMEEQSKLIGRFGVVGARIRIEKLSKYIAQTGKKYKSHYATILVWADKDEKNEKKSESSLTNQQHLFFKK